MQRTKHFLLLAASVILAGAPLGAIAQDQPMTPQEISAAWVGKKVFARVHSSGAPIELSLKADGSASVLVGPNADTGTWRLWENGYCATWQRLRGGREGCLTVVRRGPMLLVLNADQSINAEILRVDQ